MGEPALPPVFGEPPASGAPPVLLDVPPAPPVPELESVSTEPPQAVAASAATSAWMASEGFIDVSEKQIAYPRKDAAKTRLTRQILAHAEPMQGNPIRSCACR
jgi:hypothetical protein